LRLRFKSEGATLLQIDSGTAQLPYELPLPRAAGALQIEVEGDPRASVYLDAELSCEQDT